MKIFWSWQSDTSGKIGRHFVRKVLAQAIQALKEAEDVEEPSQREAREALQLDQDRQDVPGSPDLAATIFRKIDEAAIFIADVTLVAEISDDGGNVYKKLINSNVAIEYGYALRALSDKRVLMVQNTYFGDREKLPFDLKHKAGPLQYRLAPNATKDEIDAEAKSLRGALIAALRPYLANGQAASPEPEPIQETKPTLHRGMFWQPGDVLAVFDGSPVARGIGLMGSDDRVEYRFNEPHPFYLRLIPTAALPRPLNVTTLTEIVDVRRIHVLSQNSHATLGSRNEFGAIAYEPKGNATTPLAFTQLLRNGEIWSVTRHFVVPLGGKMVIPMAALTTTYNRIISNFMLVASEDMRIQMPYQIELGAVGMKGVCVSLPRHMTPWVNQVSEPIYENTIWVRRILNSAEPSAIAKLVGDFSRQIYDVAGIRVA